MAKEYSIVKKITVLTLISVSLIVLSCILPTLAENNSLTISNNYEKSSITDNDSVKLHEFSVQFYTPNGIVEIKKNLSLDKIAELSALINETQESICVLLNKNSTNFDKIRAIKKIDIFLGEMKKNGLLGDLTIKEVKELITGGYIQKEYNYIKNKRLVQTSNQITKALAGFNVLCLFTAGGTVWDFSLWNVLPLLLTYIIFNYLEVIPILIYLYPISILFQFLDFVPHPTTIGFWIIESGGYPIPYGEIETIGLLGHQLMEIDPRREIIVALTIGFTGMVSHYYRDMRALGVSLFATYKIEAKK